jgi:betaine reductase
VPKVRVMHYLNQFFAGIGGEKKADVSVDSLKGPVGPGKRLQYLFGDPAEIVVTTYCGDNYFNEHPNEALSAILQIARDLNIEFLVAGPAFGSGRYGYACAEVCHFVSKSLDIYCVSGMHPENPGLKRYKQYKDKKVFFFPTTEVVSGMENALSAMARFVSKLATGMAFGPPTEQGYIPRGFRLLEITTKSGIERAINMLLDKLADRPFFTEIPIESLETVPVAPKVGNLTNACLALITTTGILPAGNPDRFKVSKNIQWRKYSIDKLDSMVDFSWDVIHGGYNTEFMKKNPNYGVPLDVCRVMEREGVFARLYPYLYMTTGMNALIPVMQGIGREMVADMKANAVDAALLVSA